MKKTRRKGHSQPHSVHRLPVVLGFSGGVFWRPVQVFGRRVAESGRRKPRRKSARRHCAVTITVWRKSEMLYTATPETHSPFLPSLMTTTNSTIDCPCPASQLEVVLGPNHGYASSFLLQSSFANFTDPNAKWTKYSYAPSYRFHLQLSYDLTSCDPLHERRRPPSSVVEYSIAGGEYRM